MIREETLNRLNKAREARLRRMAAKQGLRLFKSRTRNPQAVDYAQFMIVDAFSNVALSGGYNMSLDHVELFMTSVVESQRN